MYLKVCGVYKKFANTAKYWAKYKISDFCSNVFSLEQSSELRKNEFWAVQDISFELRDGDVLGIIGRNGCGKTTLLRMIANIIEKDRGSIASDSKTDYLSSSGYNFYPNLTGYENIWVTGTSMGMSVSEIKKKMDAIIAYSELEGHLDMPVSYFSSGMKSRLGFSVALHMDPQILIIDETLSAGDESFRRKSFESIKEIAKNKICLFTTHSMNQVKVLATKVLYLENGNAMYFGSPKEAIRLYQQSVQKAALNEHLSLQATSIQITTINDVDFSKVNPLDLNQKNVLSIKCCLHQSPIKFKIRIVFINLITSNRYILWSPVYFSNSVIAQIFKCAVPSASMDSGKYRLRIDVFHAESKEILTSHTVNNVIQAIDRTSAPGRHFIDADWSA